MPTAITRSIERDHYIIAQALHVAIKALSAVPPPHNEPSNIADMELILSTVYPTYAMLFASQDKITAANQDAIRVDDGDKD